MILVYNMNLYCLHVNKVGGILVFLVIHDNWWIVSRSVALLN